MSKKRIMAYFLHEEEMGFALDQMPAGIATESYVLGEADDNQISALKDRGLIVESIGEVGTPSAPPVFEALHGTARSSVMRDGTPVAPRAPSSADLSRPQYYLIGLSGPLLEEWRKDLTKLGVTLMECYPTGAYKALLDPDQVPEVSALPFVTYVRLFDSSDTGPAYSSMESAKRSRRDFSTKWYAYAFIRHSLASLRRPGHGSRLVEGTQGTDCGIKQ